MFDPGGNPVDNEGDEPYGYTGEWYGGYINLLHLRARWYLAETGTFLSRDSIESELPYLYVRGNPVNWVDPSGFKPFHTPCNAFPECQMAIYNRKITDPFPNFPLNTWLPERIAFHHAYLVYTDEHGKMTLFEGGPKGYPDGMVPKLGLYEGILQGDEPRTLDFAGLLVKKAEFPVTNEVIKEGEELCHKLSCLREVHKQINNAFLSYQRSLINSNGYIYTLLSRCSLPTQFPTGNNIGSNTDVLTEGPQVEEAYRLILEREPPITSPTLFY